MSNDLVAVEHSKQIKKQIFLTSVRNNSSLIAQSSFYLGIMGLSGLDMGRFGVNIWDFAFLFAGFLGVVGVLDQIEIGVKNLKGAGIKKWNVKDIVELNVFHREKIDRAGQRALNFLMQNCIIFDYKVKDMGYKVLTTEHIVTCKQVLQKCHDTNRWGTLKSKSIGIFSDENKINFCLKKEGAHLAELDEEDLFHYFIVFIVCNSIKHNLVLVKNMQKLPSNYATDRSIATGYNRIYLHVGNEKNDELHFIFHFKDGHGSGHRVLKYYSKKEFFKENKRLTEALNALKELNDENHEKYMEYEHNFLKGCIVKKKQKQENLKISLKPDFEMNIFSDEKLNLALNSGATYFNEQSEALCHKKDIFYDFAIKKINSLGLAEEARVEINEKIRLISMNESIFSKKELQEQKKKIKDIILDLENKKMHMIKEKLKFNI